jgi:hypothetical protein
MRFEIELPPGAHRIGDAKESKRGLNHRYIERELIAKKGQWSLIYTKATLATAHAWSKKPGYEAATVGIKPHTEFDSNGRPKRRYKVYLRYVGIDGITDEEYVSGLGLADEDDDEDDDEDEDEFEIEINRVVPTQISPEAEAPPAPAAPPVPPAPTPPAPLTAFQQSFVGSVEPDVSGP